MNARAYILAREVLRRTTCLLFLNVEESTHLRRSSQRKRCAFWGSTGCALSKRYLFYGTSVVWLFFPFRGRGTHSLKLYGCALSKRCLLKAVCCIGFFVRRQLLLRLVFSILFSYFCCCYAHNERAVTCLFLLCTFPFGLPSPHGLLFRLSALICLHCFGPKHGLLFRLIKCFDLPPHFTAKALFVCFFFLCKSLPAGFCRFVLYTGCNFRRW